MLRKLILPTLLVCGHFFYFPTIKAQCLSGNCNNGFGTAVFKKKGYAKYTGAFKNRRPDGSGSAVYRNGRRYDGQWSEGMWHGEGTLMLTDGTELIGTWAFSRYQGSSKIAQTETLTASTDADVVETTPSVSEAILDKKLSETQPEKKGKTPFEANETAETEQKHEEMPEIWAVAVGVATYDDVNIPALKYPDNDAWSMYAFWKSPAGGMLDDTHSEILVDDRATKKEITTTMRKVFTKAHERDLAIFFFRVMVCAAHFYRATTMANLLRFNTRK
ncbi:MAG: hypothetical protein HC817_07595 [Saprospiraceae bacterium]|nr:hypothetical protein [Saprospiraceae bacterium]